MRHTDFSGSPLSLLPDYYTHTKQRHRLESENKEIEREKETSLTFLLEIDTNTDTHSFINKIIIIIIIKKYIQFILFIEKKKERARVAVETA